MSRVQVNENKTFLEVEASIRLRELALDDFSDRKCELRVARNLEIVTDS